jgi:HPt (histidine-containing phosphotransfer) domain-containing protein
LLPTLVKSFIDDGTRLLNEASRALQQKNAQDLRRAAHTLKSNAKNFGGSELARLCQELENRAKENNLEGAEELLASTAGEYVKVQAALETIRKTLT